MVYKNSGPVFPLVTCSWPCSPPGPPGPGQNCSCLPPSTPRPWGNYLYSRALHPQPWPSPLKQPSANSNSLDASIICEFNPTISLNSVYSTSLSHSIFKLCLLLIASLDDHLSKLFLLHLTTSLVQTWLCPHSWGTRLHLMQKKGF